MSTDFGAVPFIGGTLVGIRYWRIGDAGLTGRYMQVAWQPGNNIAACHVCRCGFLSRTSRTGHTTPAPQLTCQCGFYAYTSLTSHAVSDTEASLVQGIAEGYGRCIVGSCGFRAGNARIVAFIYPPHPSTAVRFDTLIRPKYPDVPVYATTAEALAQHPLTAVDLSALPEPHPATPPQPTDI